MFGVGSTGRLVPVSGVSGVSHAFVPDPLPPRWNWPEEMWPPLVRAKESLARLDGVARHLPKPHLLLPPLLGREAQKSSTIEGTYVEPEQLALFQMEPYAPRSQDDPANDRLEVLNYYRALRYAEEARKTLPLSLRLIRDLHRILFGGVASAQGEPGEFRQLQNAVGRPPRYVPPPPNLLPECLDAFEKYLHAPRKFDPLVDAFLVHYQFEAIHPFRDGNGRVGRLLLALTITEWCQLSGQWLLMSPYFDRNRDEYMRRLFEISTRGDWGGWVGFCLRGVHEQAEDAEARCEQLLTIERSFRDKVFSSGGSSRLPGIIEELMVLPVTTVAQVAKRWKVAYATARGDLERLVLAGVLEEIPGVKPKAFYAPEVFRATYGELKPDGSG